MMQSGSLCGATTALLAGALVLAAFPTPCPAQQEAQTGETPTMEERFLALLDLSHPDLAQVGELVREGRHEEALAAFRDRFVELVGNLQMPSPPGFWLWGHTNADRLLNEGVVGTAQYGEFRTFTTYTLGPPGEADWNKVPQDGYDVVLRDLPTMHWVGRLLEAYRQNRDPRYLEAWVGYWADFAENWLPAHEQLLRDDVRLARADREGAQTSIIWASRSILYHAWRLDNLFGWLPVAVTVSPEQAREAIDPHHLARILLHFAEWEIPAAVNRLRSIGTPNQFVHATLGMLKAVVTLPYFSDIEAWHEVPPQAMNLYLSSGYLPDGADQEQSFNYNPGLVHSLDSFLEIAEANPPYRDQDQAWAAHFRRCRDHRERFLDAVVHPDGRTPAVGKTNNLTYDFERVRAGYPARRGTMPPLREKIQSNLLGDADLAPPAFTSISFPYGGYYAIRDGWTPESYYSFMKASRPGRGHMMQQGNSLYIHALGRYMLVESSEEGYSDRGPFNRSGPHYLAHAVSKNTVVVNGFNQRLHETPGEREYDTPIPARVHHSDHFDFQEGFFHGGYGGPSFKTGESSETSIRDVRHERQVLFLRRHGLWIVTDRLLTPGTYAYTQSWNFHPDFAEQEVQVDNDSHQVITLSETGANVELHFASTAPIAHTRHYGLKTDTQVLGWVARGWDAERGVYDAAVDVHTDWEGTGDHVLVTLIRPMRGTQSTIRNKRDLSDGTLTGLEVTLDDGTVVTYVAAAATADLVAGGLDIDATAMLTVRSPDGEVRGLTLGDAGYDYEFRRRPIVADHVWWITVPTGFRWVETTNGPVPDYTSDGG